ncbi:nucleotidyltransferase domain-containing protein [Lampropedia puyangensis]|uniref:nucleotidyltransferase domain-containing protein n=1 Tax=Lampropedia puyangensis TaxID=1330072 RepID=UPI001B867A65|nr:nucleotidyltransferase domain-containing protein [Lampropedia puyangensis]
MSPSSLHAQAAPHFTGLANALFSHTQQRVLGLFFGQPQRSFYGAEVIAMTGGGSGAIQRELTRLSEAGLLTIEQRGHQKHYQANAASPIYQELCSLVQKTMSLADPLRMALVPWQDQLQAAFVYGSVAKGEDTASSDIDLMLLADDLTYGDVFEALEPLSAQWGRTINPSIYTPTDWRDRLAQHDAFASKVWAQPKIWVLGENSFQSTL